RIADLKAVEQWLTVNMSMLHGTIRALEIQRGTIATLQAFGAPIAAPATQAIATAIGRAAGANKTGANNAGADDAAAAAALTPAPVAGQAGEVPPVAGSRSGTKAGAGRETERAAGAAAAAGFADPGLSPGAWWNLLQ